MAEGQVFLFGIMLLLVTLLVVLLQWFADRSTLPRVFLQVTTELFLGREPGIAQGITSGLSPLFVFFLSSMQDIITVCLMFSLIWSLLLHWRGSDNWFGRIIDRLESAAEKGRGLVKKYKMAGLYLFMLIPFIVNGPMIGALLGKAMRIKTWPIIVTVICAQITAAAAWTLAWNSLHGVLALLHPAVPYVFTGCFILIIAVILGWGKIREVVKEVRHHRSRKRGLQ